MKINTKYKILNTKYKSLRKVAAILVALFLVGGYFFHLSQAADATWFDDSYAYRKKITIGNSGAAVSSARKVLIEVDTATLITAGKMQSDCDDTRFTDINGKTLRFFIDSGVGACNTSSTDYYVELSSVLAGNNIIYIYYGNPTALFSQMRNPVQPGWATAGGAPAPIAQYQPIAAASLTSSYSNIANPGTYNVTPGATVPTWASSTGWTWSGTETAMDTGVTPASGYTMIARFSADGGDSITYLARNNTANALLGLRPNSTGNRRYQSGGNVDVASPVSSGVMAIAGQQGYYNGVADGSPASAWGASSATTIYIAGSTNQTGRSTTIQALAIYNTTLTSDQVAAVTSAMQNLTDTSTPTFTPTSGPTLATEENTPGPAAYWKFDEGYGSTAQDSTVNNNDGSLGTGTSAPTWTEESRCIDGKCLQFDGSNDKVTVSNTVAGVKSVSIWVRPISTTGALIDLDGTARVTASSGIISATGFTSPTIYVNGVVSSTLTANTWQLVTVTTGTAISSSAIKIGNYSTTFFNGFIDEVKLYPYARSAAQVKADYTRGTSKGSSSVLGLQDQGPLSNGLVGYWKMEESSGDRADASGNGNTLSDNNTVTTNPGKFGNAGQFTGSNTEYLQISDNATLSTGDVDFTVSAWFYADSFIAPYGGTIISKYCQGCSPGHEFTLGVNTSGTVYWSVGEAATTVNSSTTVTTGRWYHVVGFFDSNNDIIGISVDNEKAVTSAAAPPVDTTQNFCIGTRCSGPELNWDGKIDEVRYYKRLLSTGERSQLYNFAPGPVGYWKLDEKTGTSANDISGNSNTGTLGAGNSAPSWTTGKYGGALNFDGGDEINSGHSTSLDIQTGITVSAWVKHSNNSFNVWEAILAKGDGTYRLHFSTNLFFSLNTSGGGNDLSAGTDITNNEWHYLTGTYDGTTQKIYIDGILKNQASLTGTINSASSTDLLIGYNSVGPSTRHWNGLIDEVKIYNYARTQGQIIQDMNAGHPLGGSPIASQVGYWKLDEGYGTTVHNVGVGGTALNGTLGTGNSAPSWTHSGKFGKALTFDGGDVIDIPYSSSMRPTDAITLTAWIKLSSLGDWRTIFSSASDSWNQGYWLQVDSSGRLAAHLLNVFAYTSFRSAASSISTGTWYHVALTYDKNLGKGYLYIDGKQVAEGSSTNSISYLGSTTEQIGNVGGLNYPFAGQIDEPKIYNSALTAAEIKADYNRGSSMVLGALSDNSSYQPNAANQEYCVPGDASTCSAPVGEWMLDEKTGTSANDTSGNGNTGTLGTGTSAPSWKRGKVGYGLNFDGSNDYVTIANESSFDFERTDTFSVSSWINLNLPRSGGESGGAIFGKRDSASPYRGYSFYVSWNNAFWPNKAALCLGLANTWGSNYAVKCIDGDVLDLSNNTWYNVQATYSGSSSAAGIKLYVNGVDYDSSTVTFGTLSATILENNNPNIGALNDGGSDYFQGIVDQVRVYNYVRTPAQVAWDFNRGGPVGWWKMDECSGLTAYDASGNGNNGTITIGASGEDTVGNCGTSSTSWGDGATGKFNSSLSFDGTDDYIGVGNSVPTNSVSFWVKPTSTTASMINLTASAYIAASSGTITATGFTSPIYYVNGLASTSPTLTANTWNHIVVTTGTSITSNTLTIGKANSAFTAGQIDDVRIYNYALTAKQVKTVMGEGAVRFGPATGSP